MPEALSVEYRVPLVGLVAFDELEIRVGVRFGDELITVDHAVAVLNDAGARRLSLDLSELGNRNGPRLLDVS